MSGTFNVKDYLASILDPEERARTMHENGWAGDPDLANAEVPVASSIGGEHQQLLAALRPPLPPTKKRGLQGIERVRRYRPHWFDAPKSCDGKAAEVSHVRADECGASLDDGTCAVSVEAVATTDAANMTMAVATTPTTTEATTAAIETHQLGGAGPRPVGLTEAIGRHLYENRGSIWPHINPDSILKPWWYEPLPPVERRSLLPQKPQRERSSDLTGREVARLYDAMSFAISEHQAVMNTHVVILWETLRVYDHGEATKVLSDYLSQARKWARVGTPGEQRLRRRQRTGYGFTFRYVYVHENGTGRGFHTHLLCTVPYAQKKAFEAWTWSVLAKLTRTKPVLTTLVVRQRRLLEPGAAISRGWAWFRYITKQLDPAACHALVDEPERPLRQVLRLWSRRDSLPVTCAKLTGSSHDIGTAAQKRAGFVSKLARGEYDTLYNGDELDYFNDAAWRRLVDTLRWGD